LSRIYHIGFQSQGLMKLFPEELVYQIHFKTHSKEW